jgi:hypothetical protein
MLFMAQPVLNVQQTSQATGPKLVTLQPNSPEVIKQAANQMQQSRKWFHWEAANPKFSENCKTEH